MSLSKLLIAVRNQLRKKLGLSAEECQVRPDGRPNPTSGDLFIAVYGSQKSGEEELELGIAKLYGVSCAITIRTAFLGDDKLGDFYVESLTGIEDISDKVEGYIHKRFEVMAAANDLIRDSSYKIIEPLRWTDTDPAPTLVRDDWFDPTSTQNQAGAVGMVMVVRFSQARRKIPTSLYD